MYSELGINDFIFLALKVRHLDNILELNSFYNL